MPTLTRQAIRGATALLAGLFLLSSSLNFGAKIPLGVTTLNFSAPNTSIAEFEVVIGLVLLAAALVSRLYPYAGAYILATVGIAEGLLSPGVQGFARSLHETMVPVAIAGWALMAVETRTVLKSRAGRSGSGPRRELVTALQFFVGALVTLGGLGYANTAAYPVGTTLGLIHIVIGLVGLYAGYSFLKRRKGSARLLLWINGVTIVYSAFSEGAAEIYALMTPGIGDALIGTIIAIIVSAVIIYLVLRQGYLDA
jgi:hypothetical protein